MSRIRVKPKTKTSVSVMELTDASHDTKMHCWSYSDCVLFRIEGHFVIITQKQAKKLFDFICKGKNE